MPDGSPVHETVLLATTGSNPGPIDEVEAARLDLLRQMADAADTPSAELALLRWLRRVTTARVAELWHHRDPQVLRLVAVDAEPTLLRAVTDELSEARGAIIAAALAATPATVLALNTRLAPFAYAFRLDASAPEVVLVLRADTPLDPPPPPPPSFTGAVAHILAARRRFDVEHERARLHATLLETQSELDEGIILLETQQRRIVYANDALKRITGYSAAELNAPEILDHLVGEGERTLVDAILGGDGDDTHRVVTHIRTRSGRRADVEVFSRSLTVDERLRFAIVRDITERFSAEAALARSETRVRQLFETFPDVIVVIRDGRVVFANPALVRSSGLPLDALLGRSVLDFVHPDDRAEITARLHDPPAAGGPMTFRTVSVDGQVTMVDVISAPIDFDGAPASLVLLRDVTEKHEMERKLLQADRLASLGTLSAGVAHEINNPLTYVLLHVNALGRELPRLIADLHALAEGGGASREELAAAVARLRGIDRRGIEIAEGVNRIEGIVRDLSAVSRSDDERLVPVDVRRCLDAALKLSAHNLRDRAQIVRDYTDVPPVLASEPRLGQVFLNLLLNAAQAITPGHPEANEVCARVVASGDRVVVEVADSGAGIPAEIIPRLFDPFFTTKPPGVGTGLGLSICHGIVAGLGGEITVESLVGLGTTFRVSLPAASARAAAAATTAPRRPRVLVVEPEPSVAAVLQRALSDENEVIVVTRGDAALDVLGRGERLDAIVCDLTVESPSAVELHARVAELHPGLERSLVFTSGGAPSPEAQALLDTVANPCLEKPFDIDEVKRVVRARVGGR